MAVNYAQKIKYAERLMKRNAESPNVSKEQHEFLKTLSEYRHLLHGSPQQYFFNTKKTFEIDSFFVKAHSQAYFEKIDLPFPKDILNVVISLQTAKNNQFKDFNSAVEQYAYQNEALNSLIEKYLHMVDYEKGTLYCPTGDNRDISADPVRLTIAKLHQGQKQISPYIEKIQKKLNKLDNISEDKLIKSTKGMNL